jgi:co-chaperonin GroES (HSP10)
LEKLFYYNPKGGYMHRIIPFGDMILVKRRIVGDKIGKDGLLYAPDQVKDANTDLADVIYVPDRTFADKEILENAEKIISSLIQKSIQGDSDAFTQVMALGDFVKRKSVKVGDHIFISKYVGTTFGTSDSKDELTLVRDSDIIGLVVNE